MTVDTDRLMPARHVTNTGSFFATRSWIHFVVSSKGSFASFVSSIANVNVYVIVVDSTGGMSERVLLAMQSTC